MVFATNAYHFDLDGVIFCGSSSRNIDDLGNGWITWKGARKWIHHYRKLVDTHARLQKTVSNHPRYVWLQNVVSSKSMFNVKDTSCIMVLGSLPHGSGNSSNLYSNGHFLANATDLVDIEATKLKWLHLDDINTFKLIMHPPLNYEKLP